MVNSSSLEILQHKPPQGTKPNFLGTTTYKIGNNKYEVAAWNHPATLAITILNWIQHTFFYGVYIVAPMGHGKTTIAQSLCHFIHLKDPRFKITWAGGFEFTHQEQFFKSLSKEPQVIIFDDISGDLKQLTDKEIEANFSSLTRIRWILDPETGKIPVICIVVGHYSKNLEKEFRAQLGMSIYAAFGNEEMTNIDTIAQKGTDAYKTLIAFGQLYSDMFEKHEFNLYTKNQKLTYKTDKPFRALAAISKTKGRIVLYSDKDVCDKCVKKVYHRLVPSRLVFDKIVSAYGNQGKLALKIFEDIRGFASGLHPTVASALDFIKQDLASIYDWNDNEMIDIIWQDAKKARPKRVYHKRTLNNKIINELSKDAVITYKTINPVENLKEIEPVNHNDLFFNGTQNITNTDNTQK